jgi:hypothetical protein
MISHFFDKKFKVVHTRKVTDHNNQTTYKVTTLDGKLFPIQIPKAEFFLAEKMKEILTQSQIDELIPLLENFEDEVFYRGICK